MAESGRVAGSAPADPDPESGQIWPESGRVDLSRDNELPWEGVRGGGDQWESHREVGPTSEQSRSGEDSGERTSPQRSDMDLLDQSELKSSRVGNPNGTCRPTLTNGIYWN
ncbi:hypothetical protein Taro_037691 [Colocasia esculenta]|uniref:Uncharacterized protein n=1 Tax=Colocasia esculenta TaxID=4460 RepID=A0A843WLG9_COLES|nr:hypothetical protein [Colocasia esculenta]